jgi:ribonuclease HII
VDANLYRVFHQHVHLQLLGAGFHRFNVRVVYRERFLAFKIGTDEAGYGPNLGPLVVTGTLWKTQDRDDDLYQLLAPCVADQPPGRNNPDKQSIAIADSKVVYRGKSIRHLERSVLATLSLVSGTVPRTLRELTRLVKRDAAGDFFENIFWLAERANKEVKLPIECSIDDIALAADRFLTQCESSEVALLAIDTEIVLPEDFNVSIVSEGNKANVLSGRTMEVVKRLLCGRDGPVLVDCDKHGGRSRYRHLIERYLTDSAVEVTKEIPEQSAYRWSGDGLEAQIRFTARGEGQLAVALASMVSKYVREVYMRAWNAYWIGHQKGLKPTKGYPEDAKRFRIDIKETQKRLGIRQEQFWRCR